MSGRPLVLVLAGVNGAGKSSIGGSRLRKAGLDWYNPDTYARFLMQETGCPLEQANGKAWTFGRDRLEAAIRERTGFAFETTLGANTIPAMLKRASATHDVRLWFCGLASVEMHLERVAARVTAGGHDIPAAKIIERWETSRRNLVDIIPFLTTLHVYDNSASALPGQQIPPPALILRVENSSVVYPKKTDLDALTTIPDWAKPIVQAAFEFEDQRR